MKISKVVERSQLVEHTIDGKTELVLDRYKVELPVPPRDWDSIVRRGVTVAAIVLVAVSVVWSTASIGDLLALAVVSVAAYGAAVAFDAAWIICMAVEWLCRYDEKRARIAQVSGHVALIVAMAAVGTHGWIEGQRAVGIVGALVSALAKGAWMVAMSVHARPLDDKTAQWVAKQRADLNGQMAMIPVRRELQRGQALIDAERRALAQGDGDADDAASRDADDAARDAQRDADDARQLTGVPRLSEHTTKTAAIHAAAAALPADASPSDIAHLLARQGLAVDTAYVRTVLSRGQEKPAPRASGNGGYSR